jgi:hypothetical protein
MSELVKTKEVHCPWCHNRLDIIRSGKSGLHYANCGSCNAHFRNIPLALLGIKDNCGTSHNVVDVASASAIKDNTRPLSSQEQANQRKGIPQVLWKFMENEAKK